MRAGWKLGSAVRKQVFKDKALLSYMVLSAFVIIMEAVLIFGSFLLVSFPAFKNNPTSQNNVFLAEAAVALIIFYVASSFTSAYVLMALFIAFKSYTSGAKISMGEAFRKTSSYSRLILEWAIFYSIIILILRIIESRLRGVGAMVVGIVAGAALSIGVMFAMPVIYEQRVGPIQAMKISAKTFIGHFGSSVGGIAYSDLYGLMFALVGFLIAVVFMLLGDFLSSLILIVVGLGLLLLFIILGATIASTTSNVFRLLLYDYASGKGLPAWLDENLVIKAVRYNSGRAPPPPASNL